MVSKKYVFKNIFKDKMLVCPKCLEMLSQTDIEGFSACPYCNFHFEASQELEDFLMQPIVDSWVRHETHRPLHPSQIIELVVG